MPPPSRPLRQNSLRVIPLGGVGEIGKNMLVFEYDEQIIVIDAGLMFPESDMLGIDIVIPDISYLEERADRVLAYILTHGHEDHIGALPYILPRVNAPVYATRLTRGLVEVKLREHKLLGMADLHTVTDADVLELGPFRLDLFHVCHSFPDAFGVALRTPVGLIVHACDYKFDPHPVDGRLTDFAKLTQLGDEGVLLLLSDSTNAESEGYTPSEREIGESFDRIFAEAEGRVIVATFASNISRVQQLVTSARKHGRRFGVVGRSMVNSTRMAMELGYLDLQPEDLLTQDEMERLPPRQVAIACTGSQGEPTSALVRMSVGENRTLQVRQGDTVVLSAVPIPGNEELVNRTVDNLFRLGADVLYHETSDIHVSGHGSREDYKLMLSLTRPKFFVPIHGEYRHLVLHARLAKEMGVAADNIFVIESGQVLEVGAEGIELGEQVTEGHVLVDGLGIGDIGTVVLRDRRHLARDGFLVAIVAIEEATGNVVLGPEILSRGFVYMRESEDLIESAKSHVWNVLQNGVPRDVVANRIRDTLAEFCYREIRRRPMILPVVLEV